MSLMALVIAAAVSQPTPSASETPNLYRAPPNCGAIAQQVSARQRESLRKLGRLPRGHLQYAVVRSLDGCPLPTPMGYHPDYLLPGQADIRRGDAPSNRR
ncbi:MAG: hypothetical protein ABW360_12550 [Phenylobacterium sp.]